MQQSLWQFLVEQQHKIFIQVIQHLGLTFIALLFAIAIGLPLGILISRKKKLATPVLTGAGILQTIPSIALLGFMIPVFGIGPEPAIVALLIYALLPIIRNTYTGISGVNNNVIEAAKSLGMSKSQLLFKVELPLAMPVIVAGIRTAAVINVGVATLASFVAAGGLGEFIFGGISLNNSNMILAGAIPAALLAVIVDQIIAFIQKLPYRTIRKILILIPVVFILAGGIYFWTKNSANDLRAGFTPEFMGRKDGDIGVKNTYHLNLNPSVVNDALMYKALYEGKLDVISGYSTDGRIKAYDLMVLNDDKKIFPPYFAAPIIKEKTLQKYPDLEKILDLLAGKISDSVMRELNYKTDYLHEVPEKVAKEFLVKNHLYKTPNKAGNETIRIGSKIFGEQYILAEMYKMLIEGNTYYNVETKTGLGGTKICFDALMNDSIDFYPEYTGTGLLVLLTPDNSTIDKVTKSADLTYQFVQNEFEKKYRIRWLKPIGFNNAYALVMRRNQADQFKIRSITDLKNYTDKK
ncbi:MAG: ABC transporter permease/substrate-binding protein [Candidatus Chryseobacterium colombiense]|nr:ABC transporter permease/substrate-binding protein [Chryseobacterium sp.]WEK70250.1 MAG: ABC transporter permease/substrate-binding protein [Chryseobacterium sp.]